MLLVRVLGFLNVLSSDSVLPEQEPVGLVLKLRSIVSMLRLVYVTDQRTTAGN